MANAGLGVPIKLLHESLGHIITVELKTGQLYRGKLAEGVWTWFELKKIRANAVLNFSSPRCIFMFVFWDFPSVSRGQS